MRNAPGKTTGDILVPLYVEQAAGESLDAAVARAEFDEVWAVLQALQEQDEVLDDIIHQMQAECRLTKGFSSDTRLRTRVEVLGPTLIAPILRGLVSRTGSCRPSAIKGRQEPTLLHWAVLKRRTCQPRCSRKLLRSLS